MPQKDPYLFSNLDEYRFGTNPQLPDTDWDSLPDKFEIFHGLNPLDRADADRPSSLRNGLSYAQHYALQLNHSKSDFGPPDYDGDGLSDYAEGLLGTLPNRKDSDNDGLEDHLEVKYGLDPSNPGDQDADEDRDGLTNADELARGLLLEDFDTDNDWLPDSSGGQVCARHRSQEPARRNLRLVAFSGTQTLFDCSGRMLDGAIRGQPRLAGADLGRTRSRGSGNILW